ncbi:MAG: HAMP domain-containing sensor histidine kinase [Thermodesulfobacteriota bacterium]
MTTSGFEDKLKWYVRMRWLTAAALIVAAISAKYAFSIDLPYEKIYAIVLIVASYNLFFAYRTKTPKTPHAIKTSILAQAYLDLFSLLLLIHFTGGAENPILFYFIFHTVLTSLLLERRYAYIQAVSAAGAVFLLFASEYSGVLAHYHVSGLMKEELYANPGYLAAIYAVFASSLFFTAYISASIAERLKTREKELSEKDRMKSEYVRIVAHDIKSPLSSALSLMDVVLEGYSGGITDKAKEMLSRARKKIEFAHAYAEDLLNLSRLRSAGTLRLGPVDVNSLIADALTLTSHKREAKGVEISVDKKDFPSSITADRECLLHVITNLILNSVEYTPCGGLITVRCASSIDRLILAVSDTGVGIQEDDIPKIFDEFYRGKNVEKTTKGTGLGLSLVKYIVETHGGTVTVESELGKGSTFTISLPIEGPASR